MSKHTSPAPATGTEPKFRVYLACCEQTMLNEIAQPECTRRIIARTYRMSIVSEAENEEIIDWPKINAAIIKRWSRSGLEYIKKQAWSGKCFEPRRATP